MTKGNYDSKLESSIREHPFFSNLSEYEYQHLTQLFTLQHAKSGEELVVEGELVDNIFIILQGQAEVRKNVLIDGKQELEPIALLNPGEAIGLSKTGFFSTTGMRTATIVALDDLQFAKIGIKEFLAFLDAHPAAVISQSMRDNTATLERMNFLREVAPFAELSIPRLRELAEKVEEINIPENTILFNQGDIGDRCYLIKSGAIEISIIKKDGDKKILSELKPASLFGAAALLFDAPRNASAKTLETSTLLVMDKSIFLALTGAETEVAESLMALEHARSRPIHSENVEVHTLVQADGEKIITLKNANLGKYFQLSEFGFFIWQQLNGSNSLIDITLAFYNQFHIFNPDLISTLILNLHHAGFVQLDRRKKDVSKIKRSWFGKSVLQIRRVMEARWAFGNVDDWLTRTYNKYIWVFYTKISQLFLALIAITGLIIFAFHFSSSSDLLNTSPIKWRLLVIAYIGCMGAMILHELAHAYTTKSFGRHVRAFGLGWFWLGPIAFCDTSDMWLTSKKARIAVDLAGIYLNLIVAGIAGCFMFFVSTPEYVIVLWLFALINYVAVITNLSPVIELDGYYTLMDMLNKPNLRKSAVAWLGERLFSKDENLESLITSVKHHPKEVTYWLATLFFIVFLEIIFSYFILTYYLLHGFFNLESYYIRLGVVCMVVFISSASIWEELKQQKYISKIRE